MYIYIYLAICAVCGENGRLHWGRHVAQLGQERLKYTGLRCHNKLPVTENILLSYCQDNAKWIQFVA